MGIALAFNILVVLWKFTHNRVGNAIIDGILLAIVAMLFSSSTALLIIGTIGSALVSLYLLVFPVKFKGISNAHP